MQCTVSQSVSECNLLLKSSPRLKTAKRKKKKRRRQRKGVEKAVGRRRRKRKKDKKSHFSLHLSCHDAAEMGWARNACTRQLINGIWFLSSCCFAGCLPACLPVCPLRCLFSYAFFLVLVPSLWLSSLFSSSSLLSLNLFFLRLWLLLATSACVCLYGICVCLSALARNTTRYLSIYIPCCSVELWIGLHQVCTGIFWFA